MGQPDLDLLAERFEAYRGHLRSAAYRMLGSLSEADDAVQEAWLRLSRSDAAGIENLGGWLTTVVSRVCLDILRTRRSRSENSLDAALSGPIPDGYGGVPEHEAMLADEVGLALLVVLDRLAPPERVAFVLHDTFRLPFDEIAQILERSTVATKKLASRARQRLYGGTAIPSAELSRQRHVVDAFLSASRKGDIDALLAVLAPDVVRRADPAAVPAGVPAEVRGARAVAEETRTNIERAQFAVPVLIDGEVGLVVAPRGHLQVALRVATHDGKVAALEAIGDPRRLAELDLAVLD